MLLGQRDSLLASPKVPSTIRSLLGGIGPVSDVAARDVSVATRPVSVATRDVSVIDAPTHARTAKPKWGIVGLLLGGLALVAGLMMCGRHGRVAAPTISAPEAPVVRAPAVPKPHMPTVTPPEVTVPKPEITKPNVETGETTITSGEMRAAAPEAGGLAASFAKDDVFALPNVTFPFDSKEVAPGGDATIEALANEMKKNPNTRIRLMGYTDSVGTAEVNAPLSRARAETVKQALISKGIDGGRIETAAMGESHPVAANGTKEGRRENRRVEAKVLSR
jgi:outer membrane protein OmpA-like peptidoglycan-associated protein